MFTSLLQTSKELCTAKRQLHPHCSLSHDVRCTVLCWWQAEGTVNVRTRDNVVHGMHKLEDVKRLLMQERDSRSRTSAFASHDQQEQQQQPQQEGEQQQAASS